MIKVLFVCHGNICRSPMAEFVLKDLVSKLGIADKFEIASAATSTEEIGNPVHYGTKAKLKELGISCEGKVAVQLKKKDYEKYDYFIGMDSYNLKNMERILGRSDKSYMLLEFANSRNSIADPWYTNDFEATYRDVLTGCKAFIEYLKEKGLC